MLKYTYLPRLENKILMTPQYLLLSVSIEIWNKSDLNIDEKLDQIKNTYILLASHKYIHATPTIINALKTVNQLSSCMLFDNYGDSIVDIFDTFKDIAMVCSKSAGVGLSITNIRSSVGIIKSTGLKSDGPVNFVTLYNTLCDSITQGGKRKGSVAIYIEPWHYDFQEIIQLKRPNSSILCKNIYFAVFMNTLLYQRFIDNESWTMFCPSETPDLIQLYGDNFNRRYLEYEKDPNIHKRVVPAHEIFNTLYKVAIETGQPFILNKDQCNIKNPLSNSAIVNMSNLCTEILIPSNKDEIGVCVLASINVSNFVSKWCDYGPLVNNDFKDLTYGTYDFNELEKVAYQVCINLNMVIDNQIYLNDKCLKSTKKYRPIGIGIQGLANAFMRMGFTFESEEAAKLNFQISESIYVGAIRASMDLAKKYGSYEAFEGSPASQGLLQPQLWLADLKCDSELNKWENERVSHDFNILDDKLMKSLQSSHESEHEKIKANILKQKSKYFTWANEYERIKSWFRHDFNALGEEVKNTGLRNGLLTAYMPTASTSLIFNNYQSFEPNSGNVVVRKVNSGTIVTTNDELKAIVLKYNFKIDFNDLNKANVPKIIKDIFKTAFDINVLTYLDYAAHRSLFIDQSQSLNIYVEKLNSSIYMNLIKNGFRRRLKTIVYYINVKESKRSYSFNPVSNSCSSCSA
jgi:ribonucleoside-diphosphate reductase alpha subunit